MKKLIILFSFVLIGLNLFAQSDSATYYFNKAYYSPNSKYKIVNYTKYLRLIPYNVRVYINRGNAYKKLGKYQLAIDDYSRAIRINPDYADAYNNRGSAKEEFRKYYCDDYLLF